MNANDLGYVSDTFRYENPLSTFNTRPDILVWVIKNNNMKKYILLSIILASIFACADLDELAPVNSIPTAQAITDFSSAQAALNGVYSAMQDNDVNMWLQ